VLLLSVAIAVVAPSNPPCLEDKICFTNLTAPQLLEAAANLERTGAAQDAETILLAVTHDPDPEARAEARFRLGQLRERRGDIAGAIEAYRALLAEKSNAGRVRLDLARLLAGQGDEVGARRELRRASAAGLPDDVSRLVDQLSLALRSRRPFGGSIEVALAPDTNINRSTRNRTVDTVIAPFSLSEDARGQSGVGAAISAQAFARGAVLDVPMLARLSGRGDIYRRSRFNDIIVSFATGPEIASSSGRWRPAAVINHRRYGGHTYSNGWGATVNWLRPLDGRTQVEVDATALKMDYPSQPEQDGILYDASVGLEKAVTPRLSVRSTMGMSRQSAREEAFASWSGRAGALLAQAIGRQIVFGQIDVSILRMDARQFLFPQVRNETRLDLTVGALFRSWSFRGLSPLVRLVRTENWSTLDLYRYDRTRVEFGLSREF
jgi:hypothetical protein